MITDIFSFCLKEAIRKRYLVANQKYLVSGKKCPPHFAHMSRSLLSHRRPLEVRLTVIAITNAVVATRITVTDC